MLCYFSSDFFNGTIVSKALGLQRETKNSETKVKTRAWVCLLFCTKNEDLIVVAAYIRSRRFFLFLPVLKIFTTRLRLKFMKKCGVKVISFNRPHKVLRILELILFMNVFFKNSHESHFCLRFKRLHSFFFKKKNRFNYRYSAYFNV